MSSLGLLLDNLPNWFNVTQHFAHSVEGDCLVIDDTAVTNVTYSITIEEIGSKIYPRETVLGTMLPRGCYNRHIMEQGHFCLGLGYGSVVRDGETAKLWWASLAEFLRIQGIATSTGRWPRHIELDHGVAGQYHRDALDAAARLDCSEEYELALLGRPSWITDTRNRLTDDDSRLLNGRSPCPRGCVQNGRRLLRRDCCDGPAVVALIVNERKRAAALDQFWTEVRADKSVTCCGTMISCPLRDHRGEGC